MRPFAIFANFQVQLSLLLGEQKLPTEDDSILFNFPNVNDLDHAAGFDSTRANSSKLPTNDSRSNQWELKEAKGSMNFVTCMNLFAGARESLPGDSCLAPRPQQSPVPSKVGTPHLTG